MSCGQIALRELGAHIDATMPEPKTGKEKKCGNCALCIHTYLGCECGLTDNLVDYEQDGCIDHIAED